MKSYPLLYFVDCNECLLVKNADKTIDKEENILDILECTHFNKHVDQKVMDLWNLPQYEQRTKEWYIARMMCISASDVSSALMQTPEACNYYIESFKNVPGFFFTPNPTHNCNHYSSQEELLLKKCDLGKDFGEGNIYTRHGQKFEQIVSNVYSQINNIDVIEFGLILHPEISFLAASPDGITSKGVMLEIKCPPSRQVKPFPPLHYFHQMMMQLECTGLDVCDYMDAHFIEYIDIAAWLSEGLTWENDYCRVDNMCEKCKKIDIYELKHINCLKKEKNYHIFGLILSYQTGTFKDGDPILVHEYANPKIIKMYQFLQWAENLQKNNPDKTYITTRYKLNEFYISRVHANHDWFLLNLPAMTEMWNNILQGRTPEGMEKLKKLVSDKLEKQTQRRKKKNNEPGVFIDLDVSAALPNNVKKKKIIFKHTECLL